MNKNITLIPLTAGLLSLPLFADKTAHLEVPEVSEPSKGFSDFVDFSLNARLRYEFREDGALDPSNAGTLRIRPGININPDGPFSLFVEGEFTEAFADDFNSGPQPSLDPHDPSNTSILDPETSELNQAYIQYKDAGFTIKAGRQRYILDNAAFIGNVGWRQNEQTFDAISVAYKGSDYEISYAYSNQANRIFGSDASDQVKELEGDMHIINGWKKFGATKIGAYAYLLDFDLAPANGFVNRASSNTFGAYVKYEGLHAEFAIQEDSSNSNLNRNGSTYAHINYSQKIGQVSLTGGVEYLDAEFYTPLATVHAFGGFADKFIGDRLGLSDSPGLHDFYAVASTKVSDVTLKGFAHYFFDDSLSEDFGWELDLVAVKPIFKDTKLLAKLAYYDGGKGSRDDIKQASLQLDYSF